MTDKKYIVGIFNDEDVVMDAVQKIRSKGIKIHEVFCPYPVHGLDHALGYERPRMGVSAFLFGITGTCLAFLLTFWTLGVDWPMNIGGKPAFAFPDFIPVMFELTVLFCAYGMVFTFFYANHLFPGRAPRVMDLRATDDRFVVAIDAKTNDINSVDALLKEAGAVEIKHNERKYISYDEE